MRVTKGCPLCRGDVFGTFETGFYCKACNLMYRKRHVLFSEVRDETKLLITKHFSGFGPKETVETEQYETVLHIPEKERQSPDKKPRQHVRPQQAAPRPARASATPRTSTASPPQKPQAMKAKKKAKASGKRKATTKRPKPSKRTMRPKQQAQASKKKQTKKGPAGTSARPSLADHPAAALLGAAGSPPTGKKGKKQGKGKKPGLEDLL